MTRRLSASALLPAALLAACAPAPQIRMAEPVLSSAWSRQDELAAPGAEAPITSDLAGLLASRDLAALAAGAMEDNPDIRIAATRIERARALLSRARLAALPQVTASLGTNGRALNNAVLNFPSAFASLDASLDLDLFGRLRGEKAAAAGRGLAAQYTRDATALGIETALAQAFVLRAALAKRIAILDATIARAARIEQVVRSRYEAGAASRVDLGQQSVRVLELKRKRTELAEALEETRTAIAVLCGREAPGFAVPPAAIDALALPELVPPAPARLIAARPDVRAFEAGIAAANGDVGAARAAFMPSISLSGEGIAESLSGGPLTTAVRAGAAVLVPIFAQGRLRSDLKVAEADQVAAVEAYRGSVLGALAEVENTLTSVAAARERAALLAQILVEARLTADLSSARYIEGEEDLLVLLDAEELLSDAEDAAVIGRQEQLFAQIALYRAMGGHRAAPAAAR